MVLLQKVAVLCLACLPVIGQSSVPLIGSQFPSADATNVPLNSSIVLHLNTPAASVQGALRKTGVTAYLPITVGPVSYTNGQIVGDIFWRIDNTLEPNTTYEFTITVPGLSSTFRFTTGADFDIKPPELVSVSPSTTNGPIDDPFAPFQFVFDEPLLSASIPVLLADGNGHTLSNPTSVSLSDDRIVLSVRLLSGPIPPILQISLASTGILDLSGNPLGPAPIQRGWTIAPAQADGNLRLVGQYPGPGDTNVPTNAALILLFDRPVDISTLVQGGLVLETDAGPVATNNKNQYANSIAVFPALLPNTTYRVHLTIQLRGYGESFLASPVDWTFTTGGDVGSLDSGYVSVYSPGPPAAAVPTNTLFVARFSNPMPAFTPRMFDAPGVLTINSGPVPVSATLMADQRTMVVTPAAPLPPISQYTFSIPLVFDIYGHPQNFQTFGKTGGGPDSTGPNVIASSPTDGMQGVPIDGPISVVFDETLGANTPGDALQLSTAGLTVNGATKLAATSGSTNFPGATIEFIPQTKLKSNTSYTLVVNGARDWAGNAGPSKTISFRTGAATMAATPSANLIRNNFSGKEIDPQLPVEIEYDQPLNAANVHLSVDISISQPAGTSQHFAIPIRVEITGGLVRATPLAAWPSGRVMTLSFQTIDLSGRTVYYAGVFRGGASNDTTRGRVTSVTPPAGTPLGPDDSIVVTFSKPMLDASGLDGGLWYSDSIDRKFPNSAIWSADRRSVTVHQGLPNNNQNVAQTMISLAISTALKDFAGNPVIPATFTWPVGTLVSAPPVGGAAGIVASWPLEQLDSLIGHNPIVLLLDRMVDEAAFNRNVLVISAGQGKVNGAWHQDGLTISFTPDSPWPSATTIHLLGFNDLLAIPYGFGRSTANIQPTVAGLPRPVNASLPLFTSFPIDGVLEVQFDQDPTPGAVTLYIGAQYRMGPVPYTEKKVRPGVVQYTPQFPLKAGDYVQISATSSNATFQSNAALVGPATTGPANLLSKTPDAGAEHVSRNALFSIRYDAAINPLTVAAAVNVESNGRMIPIQYVSGKFPSSDLAFQPLMPLPANSVVNVRVDGLEDLAGRALPGLSWSFSTSAAFDFSMPQAIGSSATLGRTGGPVVRVDPFLPITVSFNKPLDPVRTAAAIRLNPTVNVIFSDDLRTFTLQPPAVGWSRGESYSFDGLAAVDWSGNSLSFVSVSFTVVFDSDPQPPVTTAASPADGDTGVPVNTLIGLALNQPANGDAPQEVYLTHGDVRTPLTAITYSNSSHVVLVPTVLLEPNTLYQLHIGPIGTGGTSSSTPMTQSFTTGGAVEVTAPLVTYQYGSPTDPIRVKFSRVMDITRTPASVLTAVDSLGYRKTVGAQLNWSSDRQTLTITPNDPIQAGADYAISLNGLTGRGGVGSSYSTSFVLSNRPPYTPATPIVTFVPADGSTGVPTNVRMQVSLNTYPVITPEIRLFEDGVPILLTNGLNGYPLLSSRKYRIETDSFVDTNGRAIGAASSSFTTGAGPNTSPLQLLSINPANNAAGVALDTPVELTFSSVLNPFYTPTSLPQSSHAFPFRLIFETAGPVFRATPFPDWPSASTITWNFSASNGALSDLAGNQLFQQVKTTFRTVAVNDPDPPVLLSVIPAAGTVIPGGRNTLITLQFSKPIVVPSDGLQVFIGSQAVANSFPSYSPDFTAVNITVMPPVQSQVTLIGSASIQDNAENPLLPFVIQFPTSDLIPGSLPVGSLLQPRNGAINVSPTTDIIVGFDRLMDIASTLTGIRVTQNNQNVSGALSTPDGGKTFNFHPDQPFDNGAAVHVFLLGSIQDTAGYLLAPDSSPYYSFTITSSSGSAGGVLRISKRGFGASVPADAILEVEFSEDLDSGSVRDDSVWLRRGNELVSGTPSLRDGRVLRFTPSHPLVPGEEYVLTAGAALKTLDGRLFAGQNFAGQDLHLRATAGTSGPDPEIESIETVDWQGHTALHVRMTGPLSPLAARSMSLLASESGQKVPAEILSGIDGRDWWIVPTAARSGAFTISVDGAVSLSGRQLPAGRREVRIK